MFCNCTARAQHSVLRFSDLICLDLTRLSLFFFLQSTLRARIGTGGAKKGEKKSSNLGQLMEVVAIRPSNSCFQVFTSEVLAFYCPGAFLLEGLRAFRP